jgi:hypothetical protein
VPARILVSQTHACSACNGLSAEKFAGLIGWHRRANEDNMSTMWKKGIIGVAKASMVQLARSKVAAILHKHC